MARHNLLRQLANSPLTAWSLYDCSKHPNNWKTSGWEATGWVHPNSTGFVRHGDTPEEALERLLKGVIN